VPEALRRLRDHGFRLFTLTDNTLEISGRQLENAGLIDLFERRFSVDETARRHKPAPEAYASVVSELGADPRDICLIACHTWDTIGAVAAGWTARARSASRQCPTRCRTPAAPDAASRTRRSAGAAHRPST
jgi:2-haloacid dehalogenase